MNRKLIFAVTAAIAATTLVAAPKTKRGAKPMAGSDEVQTTGKDAKVTIDQMPRAGKACCLGAPSVQGGTMIGQCYQKPRQWIVIETKYTTYAKFLNQLTFTWHVVLDSKSAKENKGNKLGISNYSYFNTSVTYFNIPNGSHAACVCLPPSYLELYGEAKAIGFTISNENGEVLAGDTVSEIKAIKAGSKFWEEETFLSAMQGEKPLIERRQGLLDRSKTIWALVNPNDYEATLQ